jgi:hypothetical protein
MGMENHLHQIALWQSYQKSHLVANQEELGKLGDEFNLQSIFIHTSKLFFTAIKLLFLKVLLPQPGLDL